MAVEIEREHVSKPPVRSIQVKSDVEWSSNSFRVALTKMRLVRDSLSEDVVRFYEDGMFVTLRPAQVRELAAGLIEMADQIEGIS